ncbi:LysM peptidoglycan-binding domain-containing protein [Angustibacter aerolatus]
MTAITLAAPRTTSARGRARLVAVPSAPAVPVPRARRVPTAVRHGSLPLTRRGRLVVLALLLAVAAAVSVLAGGTSLAGTSVGERPAVRYVTVQPGETLWAIAGTVAPHVDRRDTVQQIAELNALGDSGLQAGQRLAVPLQQR